MQGGAGVRNDVPASVSGRAIALVPVSSAQNEHTPGCERLGRQHVANGSSSGESGTPTEQVLGQTVGAARQACGARVTPTSMHLCDTWAQHKNALCDSGQKRSIA